MNNQTKEDNSSGIEEKCISYNSLSRVKKKQRRSSTKLSSRPKNGVKITDTVDSDTIDNWDAETVILEPSDWQSKINEQHLAFVNSTQENHYDSDGNSSASTIELYRGTDSPQGNVSLQKISLPTSFRGVQSPNLEKLNPPIPLKILQQNYISASRTVGSRATSSCHIPRQSSPIQLSKRRILQAEKSTVVQEMKKKQNILLKRKLPDSISLVLQSERQSSIKKTKCVTDVLAKRGVTLVPGNSSQSPFAKKLNSEVSIIPSLHQDTMKPEVSKILTVDLTKETSPCKKSLNRRLQKDSSTDYFVCEVCDKAFSSAILLSKHMSCHRYNKNENINTLNANCSNLQATHQNKHCPRGSSPELALPVINLCESKVMAGIRALGIKSVITLPQLHSSSGGMFGLPVVPLELASNSTLCNIGGIGACNVLPLGKLKNLIFNHTS